MSLERDGIAVFLGLHVGKTSHHSAALNRVENKLYDGVLPQDEAKIREIITGLASHGKVLVGQAKTDARDAVIIAEAAECMPPLRSLEVDRNGGFPFVDSPS